RGDFGRVGDLRGLLREDGTTREVAFVELVARASKQTEACGALGADRAHQSSERVEIRQSFTPSTEYAVGALECFVGHDAPRVVVGQIRDGALVIADAEASWIRRARGPGRFQVKVSRPFVTLAAREVSRDDG